MDALLWIVAWVLAVAFAGAGAMKLVVPRERLEQRRAGAWARDFTPWQVRLIGLVEVAGAVGLVVPPLVDVAAWLVPLAAAGLALDMLGAYSTHLRRNDPTPIRVPSIALGVLAIVVAVGRYWIAPF
ncbi:MAG: DoxX family protein [Thermoleophilia bacterium]|nr:DoxX family protein [Thermoleophilia bacterium]